MTKEIEQAIDKIVEEREDFLDFDLGEPKQREDPNRYKADHRIVNILLDSNYGGVAPGLITRIINKTRELIWDEYALREIDNEKDATEFILSMDKKDLESWIGIAIDIIGN